MSADYQLPPGPTGSWAPTLKLIRNPREALEGWARQFGDPFLLNALNGPVVVTGREDLIREIHGQDPSLYSPFAVGTVAPLMGSGSMLILEGDRHRSERRLMMPMFHGDRMKAYGLGMQRVALERLQQYLKHAQIPTLSLMTDISLEVIVQTIFGGNDRRQTELLMRASQRVVACSSPLLFFSKRSHIPLWGLSPWDRWQNAKRGLHRELDKVIEERRASGEVGDDILSLLCSASYEDGEPISRDDIYAELMTFLFAGHETTALSLTWAMYHLHFNPTVLQELQGELDGLADDSPATLAAAPYLKGVVQETLRIHPIITETLRKLNRPMHLGDFYLPAGMAVAPATVLAHHNPLTYQEPERFYPQRFLDRTYSPFEYMPFGGGHRRCIGAAFATYEMAIVLGTLLKRYRFELIDTKPVVPRRRNVTIGPSSPVPVRCLGERD